MKLSLGMAIFLMVLGGFALKTIEDVVAPRLVYGWNMVDDKRHQYCRERSRKWYRKVTFQVQY